MSVNKTSRLKSAALAVVKGIFILTPIWFILLLTFGPLFKWEALHHGWPMVGAIVAFLAMLFTLDENTDVAFQFFVSIILVILLTAYAGTKVFSRGAMVYHPEGQPAVVEKMGISSFYPFWRMDDRTVFRNVLTGNHAGESVSGSYMTRDGRMVTLSIEGAYAIPNSILLADFRNGINRHYPREIREGMARAIAVVQQQQLEDPQLLFNALAAELANQLAALDNPVENLELNVTVGESHTTIRADI